MLRLGHRIAASTVWSTLHKAGREPTPNRTGPSWSAFIASQASAMIAIDLFTVDTVTRRRYYVWFFIEIDTRRVHLAGIATNPRRAPDHPNSPEPAGELDPPDKVRNPRPPQPYTKSFDTVLTAIGAETIHTPPRAPTCQCVR
jgi:hypothetical protein